VIEAHGHKYALDIEPDSHIGRQIHERGEPYEAKLLEHMYEQRFTGRALDIGAHVGNHALWMAVVCGLKVVAFEPQTPDELRWNVQLNKAEQIVQVEDCALGEVFGDASPMGQGRLKLDKDGDIPIRPLDAYGFEQVSVMKIDVEDMEPEVLRGALVTIEKCQPTIFAEARNDICHRSIQEVLEPMGYAVTARFHMGTRMERWDRV